MQKLLACPFCGHNPDLNNLRDSLHPVGRNYDLWTFSCLDNEGGCNASVLGSSEEDCIQRWNTRVAPPPVVYLPLTEEEHEAFGKRQRAQLEADINNAYGN